MASFYDDKIAIRTSELAEQNKWTDANANAIKKGLIDVDSRLINLETGGSSIIQPTAVWRTGFTFDCTAPYTPINGTYYVANNTEIIISGSDQFTGLDRIDYIAVKKPTAPATLATIVTLEGDLATTELVVPPDYDPSEYFIIKQIIIRALATVPTDSSGVTFSTENIYTDGLGEPNEWTFSASDVNIVNSGGIIDVTNTSFSTKATHTNNTTITQTSISSLSFKIKLKAPLGGSYIFIKWWNGTTQVSDSKLFRNGQYGLDGNSLDWQTITIDGGDFSYRSSSDIDKLQIYPFKSFLGYQLDDIKINVGSSNDVVIGGIEEAPLDGKEYNRKNGAWIEDLGVVGTLQEVTDKGNVTTNNITTQGIRSTGTRAGLDLKIEIGDYDLTGEGGNIVLDDAIGTLTSSFEVVVNNDLTANIIDSNSIIRAVTYIATPHYVITNPNNGFNSHLYSATTPTNNRDFNLPDASGIIVILSDITTAPTSSTDSGSKGEVRVVGGFRYECIATNTWVRSVVTTTF